MTKQDVLTVRWNNRLTVGLGVPTLIFAAVTLVEPVMSAQLSFIVLAVIGSVY